MKKSILTEKQVQAFHDHLVSEEKSAVTVEGGFRSFRLLLPGE